jgi:hypothetical protein
MNCLYPRTDRREGSLFALRIAPGLSDLFHPYAERDESLNPCFLMVLAEF